MNVYVGNLNYSISEEELQDVFSQVGEVVSVKIIQDRETGKSKGFGFVEYTNDADAEAAIETLNGMEVMGRNMLVNKARQRKNERESRY